MITSRAVINDDKLSLLTWRKAPESILHIEKASKNNRSFFRRITVVGAFPKAIRDHVFWTNLVAALRIKYAS